MPKKLTDTAVADLGRRYKQHRALAEEHSSEADAIKVELLEECKRRSADSIDVGHVIVTRKQSTKRWIDAASAKALLSRSVLAKVLVPSVDRATFEMEVNAGKIPADVAERCRRQKDNAPYIDVTLKADVADAA